MLALVQLGIAALGVDASPRAWIGPRSLGAAILERSVFDALPGEGRWPTVLLFDGNVGHRRRPGHAAAPRDDLLAPHGRRARRGRATGHGHDHATQARLEDGDEARRWFPWAWVGADGIDELAGHAGLVRVDGGSSAHDGSPSWSGAVTTTT